MKNHVPVIKKTSLGIADPVRRAAVRARGYKKLKCSDPKKHIPYIDRYGTLQDEMGTPIAQGMRMRELETRLALSVNPNCDIICLSFSLPLVRTAEAQRIVEDFCRENFGTFLSAFHATNKKGEAQPHVHLDIFNDIKHHPLNRLVFLQEMKQEIGRRFEAAGITFSEHKPRSPFEPTGDALNAERRKEIEAAMKAAFVRSLDMSRYIDDWQDALKGAGLSVSRTTKAGLVTLENGQGYKMRLERISDGKMKTKNDVSRYFIAIDQQPPGQPGQEVKEEVKMEDLRVRKIDKYWSEDDEQEYLKNRTADETEKDRRALGFFKVSERAYGNAYARRAAALTFAGLSPEQIQAKLDPNPAPAVSDNIPDRRAALDLKHKALGKGLSSDDLYNLEKAAKTKGVDLSKALSAVQQSSSALTACAQGDAMPMIMMLANIITPLIQAAAQRQQKPAGSVTTTMPARLTEDLREKAAKSKRDFFASKKLLERLAGLVPGEGLTMAHGKAEAGKVIPTGSASTTINPDGVGDGVGDKPGN